VSDKFLNGTSAQNQSINQSITNIELNADRYIKSRAADRLKILIAINRAIKKFNRD